MASTHERIVNLIRDIAEVVNPNGRFIYGREVHASFDYNGYSVANSESSTPLISLFPVRVTDENNPDLVFDRTPITMMILRSADVADSAAREEEIVNEMAQIAEDFKVILKEGEIPVEFSVSNIEYEPNYLIHMGTASGVIMTFNLSIIQECPTNGQQAKLNQFRNRNGQ